MVCCLAAPNHSMNYGWLMTNGIHIYEGHFTGNSHEANPQHVFRDYTVKITSIISAMGRWLKPLHYWGRARHICVSYLKTTGSDNGLSPDRHQSVVWTNDRILSVGPLEINFHEISFEIRICTFKTMHLKMPSFRFVLNLLMCFFYGLLPVHFTHCLSDYFEDSTHEVTMRNMDMCIMSIYG